MSSACKYLMYCSFHVRYREYEPCLNYLRNVDWDDVCEEFDFTELHKVVFGLSLKSLDAESLSHAQNLDKGDRLGRTALYFACSFGREDYTGILLSHGADPNAGAGLFLPLGAAISSENRHCVTLLLEHEAKIPVQLFKDSGLFDDLGRYVEGSYKFENADQMTKIDKLLFEHGFDFDFQNRAGYTLLMRCSDDVPPRPHDRALRSFRRDRLELLLGMAVNIELEDKTGKTALSHAVMNANAYVFKRLIHAGARLNTQTIGGLTILHLAILYADNVGIVQALIDTSTSVIELEAQDTYGASAFDLMKLRVRGNGYLQLRPDHYEKRFWITSQDPYFIPEGRCFFVALDPEEAEILAAFDVLFRKLQDERGVRAQARYPTSRSLVELVGNEEREKSGALREMDSIPGAWLE